MKDVAEDLEARRALYIGCACDRKFVEPTAAMLASVDINGEVPEATVIIAGFGLTGYDRAVLQAGAGNRDVRFVDAERDVREMVEVERFTLEYPVPVLGRLFVASHIEVAGARLVTIDSDMIVNASLRPLVDRDLDSEFFAAIHDPPRTNDRTYFNSGLMMFDVDTFKRYDIAGRCLRWLAEQEHHPSFPDQDALNWIVGRNYHRLARTWNYFCYNDAGFTSEDYETCKVAHFAGPKPWNDGHHPGAALYNSYLAKVRARVERAGFHLVP